MHAVTIVEGRLEWSEHADPVPGAGEVLVRVRAAGLNGADIQQRAGRYPAPAGSPVDIPGLELAGEVVTCGPGVQGFAPGDRVMAIVGGGAQAELAVVHARHLLRVPDEWEWSVAGGFPEAFATAYDALFTQGELAMGERVCISGAAGGVGLAAVQLAVATGASVVATVRNEGLRADVAAHGATVVAPDQFVEAGPFDVVLELVGAPNLPADLSSLATGGRIVVIGVGAGVKTEINLLEVMVRRAVLRGSTLRSRSLEDKALVTRAVEHHVLPLAARGAIGVPVEATFPMADADAAYERFTAGGKLGKIVLVDV